MSIRSPFIATPKKVNQDPSFRERKNMKTIASIIIGLLFSFNAWSTISSTTNWDVRTTGNDANGGGYDPNVASPGTDFSQQNAAQVTYTDLIIGATTTQLTSAAHAFDSTFPGNVLHITGGTGCTTGWYEMLSESGVIATMDRSVGTATSTCTGQIGGALATIGQAKTNAQDANIIFVKTGTYTITSTIDLTSGHPIVKIQGFNSTHTDGGTPPTLTTATNSVHLFTGGSNSILWMDNFNLTNTAVTHGDAFNGGQWYSLYLSRSTIGDTFQNGINGSFIELTVENSEIKDCVGWGTINQYAMSIQYSYIHGCGSGAVNGQAQGDYPFFSLRSVYASNGAQGVGGGIVNHAKKIVQVFGNVFYKNNSFGFDIPTPYPQTSINEVTAIGFSNNIVYGQTHDGGVRFNSFTYSLSWGILANYSNAYGANTGGDRVGGWPVGPSDVSLSGDPFVNAAGGNFALNNTAGAGAACKAAGYPQTFGLGLSSTTSTPNIGITESSGGSSATTTGYTFAWLKNKKDKLDRAHFYETAGMDGLLALGLLALISGIAVISSRRQKGKK